MLSTFSSHPSIKIFDPKDINPNFDKAEDAVNINDETWEGLENNNDDGTTQDSNNQAQQADSNSSSSSFLLSFFFFSLLFFIFSSFLLPKKKLHKYGTKAQKGFWLVLVELYKNIIQQFEYRYGIHFKDYLLQWCLIFKVTSNIFKLLHKPFKCRSNVVTSPSERLGVESREYRETMVSREE